MFSSSFDAFFFSSSCSLFDCKKGSVDVDLKMEMYIVNKLFERVIAVCVWNRTKGPDLEETIVSLVHLREH